MTNILSVFLSILIFLGPIIAVVGIIAWSAVLDHCEHKWPDGDKEAARMSEPDPSGVRCRACAVITGIAVSGVATGLLLLAVAMMPPSG